MRAVFLLLLTGACGEGPRIVVEPLQILSWVPNHGAQCVAAPAAEFEAVVTFSDQLDSATISAETLFLRPDGAAEALDVEVASTGATATVTIRADLDYDAVYELVAKKAIEGVDRGQLAQDLISPFRTISAAGCF